MIENCFNCKFKSFAASKLTDEQTVYLCDNNSSTVFGAGENIFKEGALSLNIVYIKTGLVKLHMKGLTEHEHLIKIVKAPNYLGIPSSVGDKINQYSVTAIEETSVCFIALETFQNLLLGNKDFAYQIIVDLCKKELETYKSCLHKIQKQSAGLLADTLLNFASSIYDSTDYIMPLSRQELADLIGTSRENVSRNLSEFQKDGLIHIDKKNVKILDVKRLKTISGLG